MAPKSAAKAKSEPPVPATLAPGPDAKRPCLRPVKLELPDAETSGGQGARNVMKQVIPWVVHNLPETLQRISPDKVYVKGHLAQVAPLKIKSESSLSSYKQPWIPENCHDSCQASGLYEVAGNLFWVDPELVEVRFPMEDPAWSWVHEAATSHFHTFEYNGKKRIKFPIVMPTCTGQRVGRSDFPASGQLLPLSGHAFLYSWYVAMFLALDKGNDTRVMQLFECALTVTISMFGTVEEKVLATESIRMSEMVRTQSKTLVDNFIVCGKDLDVLGEGRCEGAAGSGHQV